MIINYIKKLQEILEHAQNENLSAEVAYIFNESKLHLPFVINSFSVQRTDRPNGISTDFYRVLNKDSQHDYAKQFKNQKLHIQYDDKINQDITILLIDLLALYLNERIEHHFEKDKVEEYIKEQNEEHAALLRMFCHDLVNPLSILNMSLEFMEDADDEKKFTSIFNRMKKSSEALQHIIQSLRDLNALQGRRKHLVFETLSLKNLFKECKKGFDAKLKEKNISLNLKLINCNDVEFLADKDTFQNYVLNNLISNAIKFSAEDSSIEIVAEKANDQIILNIVDHGIGMSDQQLSNIFKFDKGVQRLGTRGENGHGIGLQFCRYALKLHGFKLQISSKIADEDVVNKNGLSGTVIKLTIPMSA